MNKLQTAALTVAIIASVGVGYNTYDTYLNDSNTINISLYGEVAGDQQNLKIIETLKAATSQQTVNIYALSPGGDVIIGYEIAAAMENSRAHVVYHVGSMAASMAAMLICHAPSVDLSDSALIMFHEPFTADEAGNRVDLDENDPMQAKVLKNARDDFKKCGFLTDAEIQSMHGTSTEVWLTGKEIKERMEANRPFLVRAVHEIESALKSAKEKIWN